MPFLSHRSELTLSILDTSLSVSFPRLLVVHFFLSCFCLQAKDLLENGHGVLGALDRVADGAGVLVDFVVVAALGRLVAEKVNVLVGDAVGLLGLVFEVLEAVRLVPAGREDVKRDLASNGECQAPVPKLFLEHRHKLFAHLGLFIILLEFVALLVARVAADGANIDHAVAKLDKGAALDGNLQVSDVAQHKVGELLVAGLADPLDEAVGRQRLAELERGEAVFRKAKVKERRDGCAGGPAELLLLLGEVGAADEANGALLAQGAQDGEDLGGGAEAGGRQGAVDIEEADGVFERTLLERGVGSVGHDVFLRGGGDRKQDGGVRLCL